ncbi:MAG: hypothetical protein GX638_16475, partial [Crenarchaeota archaeon]|nr:hypothetical protein [Thermoproteota archaeon]
MFKLSKCSILLSLIVCFSFIFRILLIFWGSFPPSSDLGLHNSVVYSITQSGNTDFLWNYYNMGEGVSLTFPGYHIFVSYIIILTGLPEYLVHSLVAAFFSSFIILVAFLITRKISNTSAALIVAFLAAFSRFDIEMLMWGGYPNVVTLMLIPLAFYLLMQRQNLSLPSFLVITSLVYSAIFLTHSLSMAIFVVIVFVAFIFITIVPKTFAVRRLHSFVWILPLFFGVLIIFPFVVDAVPTILNANSGVLTGNTLNLRLATLSTQTVNWDFIYPLFFYFIAIFLFSKKQNGKFFTIPVFLLVLWILVPAVGSQSHLLGFYTDYNRFRYFVYLPIIIVYGIVFDCASGFFAKLINTGLSKTETFSKLNGKTKKLVFWIRPILTRKTIYAFFILILLLYSLFSVSMFLTPSKGIEMQEYYQIMNEPLYDAMQWIKANTSPDSIIASDAR